MIRHDYHDKTPDLADRLAKDIAAALRLDLDFTVTTVRQSPSPVKLTGDAKVRYYFEADLPADPCDEFLRERDEAVA